MSQTRGEGCVSQGLRAHFASHIQEMGCTRNSILMCKQCSWEISNLLQRALMFSDGLQPLVFNSSDSERRGCQCSVVVCSELTYCLTEGFFCPSKGPNLTSKWSQVLGGRWITRWVTVLCPQPQLTEGSTFCRCYGQQHCYLRS